MLPPILGTWRGQESPIPDRLLSASLRAISLAGRKNDGIENVRVEAGVCSGVTGRTDLINLHQNRVAVAVESYFADVLHMAAGLALDPQGLTAAAEVRRAPGGQGESQRFVIHPGNHQNVAGCRVLGHCGQESCLISTESLSDGLELRRILGWGILGWGIFGWHDAI